MDSCLGNYTFMESSLTKAVIAYLLMVRSDSLSIYNYDWNKKWGRWPKTKRASKREYSSIVAFLIDKELEILISPSYILWDGMAVFEIPVDNNDSVYSIKVTEEPCLEFSSSSFDKKKAEEKWVVIWS